MSEKGNIKVRIAPSPTGFFHIGTARTALFNWLFAKKNNGKFILRVEDTDLERSNKEYENDIKISLEWLGLDWDEFYLQSERAGIYEKYIRKLLDSGKAFWCYHTQEELDAERQGQIEKKESQRHICKYKLKKPASAGEGGIIRLAVDENSTRVIHFKDEIRDDIEWEERLLGDFSLAKDLRMPLYNLAVVIDDLEMEISHVIRGEDHISNTPKQILIYEALGRSSPKFAHLPMILGTDKSKLSKRHGAVSISEYRKDYLPDALVNFMVFLGYTYENEILNREEMIVGFNLEKIHKSPAIFNIEKLNWINSQYIRKLPLEEFKKVVGNGAILDVAVPLITERLEKLSDVENFNYFWEEPQYETKLLKWKNKSLEESRAALSEVQKIIEGHNFSDKDSLRSLLDDLGKHLGDRGLAYWPLRVALSGRDKSPDPMDIAYALGKKKTLERVEGAIRKITE